MDKILTGFRRAGRAAFRMREYAALLGKRGYARLVLHRLKERGELVLVKRGWWAFPESIPEAVACELSRPCYVSFHSALFLHGLTTQTPRSVQVAVARRTKPSYEVFGLKVKEFKIAKSRFNNFSAKDGVLLASSEKAFADCISLPRTCPDFILREVVEKIDVDLVRQLLSSKAAVRRLEQVMNIKDAFQE